MYRQGKGVQQDYAEAAKWYRKAANQGDIGSQYNLGRMYRDGLGVPQNWEEAVKLYRKGADQGDAYSQHSLGEMYWRGQGVLQDDAEAVMSRTRFPWTQNWLNRSVQGGPEHDR